MASTTISPKDVSELRARTGAGMMDCKRALEEAGGDMEKAGEILRKKGIAKAEKRAGRTASQGLVVSYIHHNGQVGVLVEHLRPDVGGVLADPSGERHDVGAAEHREVGTDVLAHAVRVER